MITGVVCFFLAAFMEMFIVMKSEKENYGNIIDIIRSDLKTSIEYMSKDNPVMLKVMIITAGINLFLTSMILIGLPAMIKVQLGLSNQLYGLTQGAMAAGMISGGMAISVIGKKVKPQQAYKMLAFASIGLIPIALAFSISLSPMVAYWIISLSCFVMMVVITMFSITMMSFIQRETPNHLIGKVISYVLVMTQFTLPVGQAVYGFLFEAMANSINIIVFVTALCSGGLAIYSKKIFSGLSKKTESECVPNSIY